MEVSAYRVIPPPHLKTLQRLNLGCGLRHLGGFVNIDKAASVRPDLVLDLERVPLPFEDSSCAEVQAHDFLEHLSTPDALIQVVNECWRVLDPCGTAQFRVPNAASKDHPDWALRDPTHARFFVPATWTYFEAGHEQYESNGRFYGILPWTDVQIMFLDGDGTIQVTMRPLK